MQVPSLGREDPLKEGMVTHSSTLAWSIQWTEETGGHGVTESDTTGMTYHAHTHTSDKFGQKTNSNLQIKGANRTVAEEE